MILTFPDEDAGLTEREVRDFWKAVYLSEIAKGALSHNAKDTADAAIKRFKDTFQ